MQVLGVTIDGMPVKDKYVANPLVVGPFVQRFNINFPTGSIDPNIVNDFGQYSKMTRTFVPFLYFIDKTGAIRAQYMGSDSFFQDEPKNIRSLINSLFPAEAAKPAAAPKPPAKTTQPVKKSAPAPATAKK